VEISRGERRSGDFPPRLSTLESDLSNVLVGKSGATGLGLVEVNEY
jgi:hypothetical protein